MSETKRYKTPREAEEDATRLTAERDALRARIERMEAALKRGAERLEYLAEVFRWVFESEATAMNVESYAAELDAARKWGAK